MGLTLHYNASIRDKALIPKLIEEVEDICQSMNWQHKIRDDVMEVGAAHLPFEPVPGDPKPLHLQGITFTPPGCETVSLLFAPSGRITSYINLIAADAYPDPEMVYSVHVKTQFAGPDLHVALVMLLKHLEKKYLKDMEVFDEGDYWNTMDKAVLQHHFDNHTALINAFRSALEEETFSPEEDADAIANKIMQIIRKFLREGGNQDFPSS